MYSSINLAFVTVSLPILKHRTVTISRNTSPRNAVYTIRSQSTTLPPRTPSQISKTPSDYTFDLSDYPLLTQEQEQTLLTNIRTLQHHEAAQKTVSSQLGRAASDCEIAAHLQISEERYQCERAACVEARNELVAHNLRLVIKIASSVYKSSSRTKAAMSRMDITGVSIADLVQEGSLGLIRAAERFDMTRGERFSTYAFRAIWSHCRRAALPASCIVSIPDRLKLAAGKLRKFRSEYEAKHGVAPDEELEASVTAREDLGNVRRCERHLSGGVFLDGPVRTGMGVEEGGLSLLDRLVADGKSPLEVAEEGMMRTRVLRACFRQLSERDAAILVGKFGLAGREAMKGREIAEVFGISEARVAQIVSRALGKLRENEAELAEYVE